MGETASQAQQVTAPTLSAAAAAASSLLNNFPIIAQLLLQVTLTSLNFKETTKRATFARDAAACNLGAIY